MRSLFLYAFSALLFCGITLHAQSSEKNKVNPSHFLSVAPGVYTNGFGLNIKWANPTNQARFNYFNIDLSKIRHPKEFRYLGNGRYNGFVFGRKNVVMPVNLGYGKYRVLGVRNSKNDIGVACTYQGGFSFAFLKPVYLYVDKRPGTSYSSEERIKYDGESTIDLENILGGAPFFVGFNQMKVVPGAYVKAAMLFSWGKYYNDYHVLEIGFLTEVYSKELPLMANTSNSFIYPSFYINLNLGKFW